LLLARGSERMMILWIAVFMVGGALAALGVVASCAWVRDRHIRLTLGIPEDAEGDLDELQTKAAVQKLFETELRIEAAVPHLDATQRRKLALALANTKSSLPSSARAEG
jgi:hypothetical protein